MSPSRGRLSRHIMSRHSCTHKRMNARTHALLIPTARTHTHRSKTRVRHDTRRPAHCSQRRRAGRRLRTGRNRAAQRLRQSGQDTPSTLTNVPTSSRRFSRASPPVVLGIVATCWRTAVGRDAGLIEAGVIPQSDAAADGAPN